jgi:hypothetical protein
MEKQVGSIGVTENGVVVLLTDIDASGEINGQTKTWDEGITLSPENTGTKFRVLYGRGFRVVSSAREVLRLLAQSGVDLKTPAERPLSSMSLEDRLAKVEQDNAALRAQLAGGAK